MSQKTAGFLIIVSVLTLTLITTPLTTWHEHTVHFALLGLIASGYLIFMLRSPGAIRINRLSLVALSLALLFLSFHALPCPLLLTPHNSLAVSNITHPCCVSVLPALPVLALLILKRKKHTAEIPFSEPILPLFIPSPGNKSPPFLLG